jgi:hypothetical protein
LHRVAKPAILVMARSIQACAAAAHRPNGLTIGTRRDKPVLDRKHRGARTRVEIELFVDACQMVLHGPRRDHERLGDLAVPESARQRSQHVDLAVGQIVRPRDSPTPQPRRLDDGANRLGIETTGEDLVIQNAGRIRGGVRLTI